MSNLVEYVLEHTLRSACRCGKCIDPGDPNVFLLPHTVNMYFFDVCAVNNPNVEEFRSLIEKHIGEFSEVDPFSGEHSYLEIGGWIGDQSVGIQFMALGKLLGLWQIMQPGMLLNVNDPEQKVLADQMAGMGMISIVQ
jgi:hypothetical protein